MPQSTPKLPSRYEDLRAEFRGRLEPDPLLIAAVKKARATIAISGGIRFLPVFGKSGSGKSCAARELSTHLPECEVFVLTNAEIESREKLVRRLNLQSEAKPNAKLLIAIVDQYEDLVVKRSEVPTSFVESISILDRIDQRSCPTLFIWLTTSEAFQRQLEEATTRNTRILLERSFAISGPDKSSWPKIIQETFSFHNSSKSLDDFSIIENELAQIAREKETLGQAIERVGEKLSNHSAELQDISDYQIILLWPVANATGISRIHQFTKPREGYLLNWGAFFRETSKDDRIRLPMSEYNRARLYFDMRLVPLPIADLHPLCRELDSDNVSLANSYLKTFSKTHFFSVLTGCWNEDKYSPLREHDSSARAASAKEWYRSVTNQPVKLGRRLALILKKLGVDATHEEEIITPFSSVKADTYCPKVDKKGKKVIIEIKAYSPSNTVPSTIRSAIQTTLRRHAQLAGFIQKQ